MELGGRLEASRGLVSDGQGMRVLSHWCPLVMAALAVVWAAALVAGFKVGLAACTALAFLAAGAGLIWPIIGLFGVSALCVLDTVMRQYLMGGGLLRWHTFNYWLLLVILLGLPVLLRQRDPHTRLLKSLLALMIAEALMVRGDSTYAKTQLLNSVSSLGILWYCLRACRHPWGREAWAWLGLVVGTLTALASIVYLLQKDGLAIMDANAQSYMPLAGLISVCMSLSVGRPWPRLQLPLAALGAINFGAVYLSTSRGSTLVGIVCMLALLVMIRGWVERLLVYGTVVAAGLAVLLAFPELQHRTYERFAKLADTSLDASRRTSGRSDLALGAWRVFLEHPFGIGTGGSVYAWLTLENREGLTFGRGGEFTPHSAWLRILVENGLPGLVLLGSLVASFAVVGMRRSQLVLGLLATGALSVTYLSTEFYAKGPWFLMTSSIALLQCLSEPAATLSHHREILR
jgi:hypothetical protein